MPWDEESIDLSTRSDSTFFSVLTSDFAEHRHETPTARCGFSHREHPKTLATSTRVDDLLGTQHPDEYGNKHLQMNIKIVAKMKKLQCELRTQKARNTQLASENERMLQKYGVLENAIKLQSLELQKLLAKIQLLETPTS